MISWPPKRFDEVAGLPLHAVAVSRSAIFLALEAHEKETSHGASCDRSGRKEIPSLSSQQRRSDPDRSEGSQRGDPELAGGIGATTGDRRDLHGGVRDRGPGAVAGSRRPGGAVATRAHAR